MRGTSVMTGDDKSQGNMRRDVHASLFHLPVHSNCHISLVWIVFFFPASFLPLFFHHYLSPIFFPSLSLLPWKETLQK